MSAASQSHKITFGTDGWRGIIADSFTFANVCRVTRAIARYLATAYSPDQPVLVGYDTRFLADQFAHTAAQVLAELGWTVKLVDRDCPTPVMAYNARHLNSAGALMFTASHNPAAYCGLKYIPDYAGPATTQITDAIVATLETATDTPPSGQNLANIERFNPKPAYLEFIYSLLDIEQIRRAHLRVQYDALYSTSRGYLDEVLQHCGCETESFHTYRDVLFGGGSPEPTGEQLSTLVQAVQQSGADLGLATDGDSDRFGVVDDQGTVLEPNTILLLLARHLVKNKGKTGAIVRTVATTQLLDHFAAQHGLRIYETPVGFKYIGEKMRETSVLIGGEESGGLSVIDHIPEKDGILANMLIVEAIAYEGKSLSQLVAEVIAEVGGPLHNHRLDRQLTQEHQAALLTGITQITQIAGIGIEQIGHKDGIKLYLAEGSWILLRPSGTEPLMRVYIETDSLTKVAQLTAAMQQFIDELKPGTIQ